ncbi:MAG TPA: RNB domain-containing ribonuclease [Bacteriovoracaceae bacterium]|nr:RNB domain-containing ribonuclease [Bacteriovoracaceae bacterium]
MNYGHQTQTSNNKHNDEIHHHRYILRNVAHKAMIEHKLLLDFSPEAISQLALIEASSPYPEKSIIDLRQFPWCSIDNDDSMDLDQLTVAQINSNEKNIVKILVAIADVDAFVRKGSPLDNHAKANTTSIYTAAEVFPMFPNKLSTNLTSLNPDQDHQAIVIEMDISLEGKITKTNIYQAMVHNYAKLTYNSVAAWLEDKGPIPESVGKNVHLSANIILQDKIAQLLRENRHKLGALDFETIEAHPIFHENTISSLEIEFKNRAKELIEDFMVAANSVSAKYLKSAGVPSFRRVVRHPKRWDRIISEAAKYKYELPTTPNASSLAAFLNRQKILDPMRFPDLSLTIIKLLGKGEYVVEFPEEKEIGHFGLAVMDYTHSTAPNRRFPDLITQRMLKGILKNEIVAYNSDELIELAQHCTDKEDDANKVERRVAKSAGALILSSKIGKTFSAICTGAAEKGTWVRIINPPVEGRMMYGHEGIDVGDKLQVTLIHTDVEKGFIDFKRA